MPSPIVIPRIRFVDDDGDPVAGGWLYTYKAGTTTQLATYADSTGLVANPNPIQLNADGEAVVWLGDTDNYDFRLENASNVTMPTPGLNVPGFLKVANVVGLALRADLANPADPLKGIGMSGFHKDTAYPEGTAGYELRKLVTTPYVITPELFGAKGDWDGATGTDDTAALQSWLNHGGSLHLWPGKKYRATAQLTIGVSGTKINGNGGALICDTAAKIDVLFARDLNDVLIDGLEIDGKASMKPGTGSTDIGRGIMLYGCQRATVSNCYVHDCFEHGIRAGQSTTDPDQSSEIILTNNRCINNGSTANSYRGFGIWCFGRVYRTIITGNICVNNVGGGIGLDDVSSSGQTGHDSLTAVISDNIVYTTNWLVEGFNTLGLWVGGTRQYSITGNVCVGYRHAMQVEDSQANTLSGYGVIAGNYLEAGMIGLGVYDVQNLDISGNTILSTYHPSLAVGVVIESRETGTAPNNVSNVTLKSNVIVSKASGVRLSDGPWLGPYTAISNRVTIADNDITCTEATPATNADGIRASRCTNLTLCDNRVSAYYNGYWVGSTASSLAVIEGNKAKYCINYGIGIAGAGARILRNTTYSNTAGGIQFAAAANDSTTLVKDNEFLDNTVSEGSYSSTVRQNNYPALS